MSLGIGTIWRARAISPTSSLVTREPVASSSPSILRRLPINNLALWRRPCVSSSRRFAHYGADIRPETSVAADHTRPTSSADATADAGQTTFAERLALVPVWPHDANSILVRSRMEYPNPKETRLNDHFRYREMETQRRHEALARANHEPMPNWRTVLQELVALTPRYMSGVVRVTMPEAASSILLDPDTENNLWDIGSRTSCYMVLAQERDASGNLVLKISGPRTAVEQAIDNIVQVAKEVEVLLEPDTGPTVLHNGIDRGTKSGPQIMITRPPQTDEVPNPRVLTTMARDLPERSHWTKKNLQQYVATLTRSDLPTWRARDLYHGLSMTHQSDVLQRLVAVFYDPRARRALSGAAFKLAFGYTARRGRAARLQARLLFNRMEQLGIPTDTTVFNLLMESTIHDRDLRGFSTCVFLMGRRGLEPNLRTWLLFLRLILSEEVRRYVLQAIIHKNLLVSAENMAQVAYEMATYDAERGILNGLGIQALLAEQNKLYGSEWQNCALATPICNKIVEVLAKHSKWDRVNELIDFMATRPSPHIYPNEHTLSICVEHLKVQSFPRSAIDFVVRFEALGKEAGMRTLRSLFLAFWQHSMVHSLDVLWQYAQLMGRTTSDMAFRVGIVLHKAETQGWHADAGVHVTSMQSETIPRSKKDAKHYALFALLMASSRDMFGVEKPAKEKNLMRLLRKRSFAMRAEGRFVPAGSLGKALRDAAEKDTRFHKSLTKGSKWVIEPALLSTEQRESEGSAVSEHPLDDLDDSVADKEYNEDEASPEAEEDHQHIGL